MDGKTQTKQGKLLDFSPYSPIPPFPCLVDLTQIEQPSLYSHLN